MRGVLHGFLGTYTSRYSDHRGYWLFGQLPRDLERCTIDLLGTTRGGAGPVGAMRRLAVRRFAEQVRKSGLRPELVREASLTIVVRADAVRGCQGEHEADGRLGQFGVRAVMDTGRVFERERTVFVAPHDPDREWRRRPEDWGA